MSRYLGGGRRSAFPIIDNSPFFSRGEVGLQGEKVQRSVPDLFGDAKNYRVPRNSSGRLQLAQWITNRNNPLTARVAVNRFWHWMMDSLPKVVLAESCGYDGAYLLPPETRAPWARESLTLLGIAEGRLATKDEHDLVVERLHVPTYFCGYNAHLNPRFLQRYREAIRSAVPADQGGPEHLFIGRSPSAPARRVLNQDELAASLAEFGFYLVYFENLSLSEQIRLARSARVMVGPHSSGLTHQLFMNEGATVIELVPFERKVTNDCYEQLALAVGHTYRAVVSDVDQQTDIVIAPSALTELVRAL